MASLTPRKIIYPISRGAKSIYTMGYELFTADSTDSVSLLRLHDPPLALVELLEEVNYLSPKQVGFIDGRGMPGPQNACDCFSNSDVILITLNPHRATVGTVAHELMHAFLFFGLGYEDLRHFRSAPSRAITEVVTYIQSAVIDCKVLEVLEKRGDLDMSEFYSDIITVAFDLIDPLSDRKWMHSSPYTDLVTALSLSVPTAFPELYRVSKSNRKKLAKLWRILESHPKVLNMAREFTRAMKTHGYQTNEGAVKAIDCCLVAAFKFLRMDFDLKRDMVPRVLLIDSCDKIPSFAPGAPVAAKHELLRKSILQRRHFVCADNQPEYERIYFRFAPEGEPFSALNFPPIVRPERNLPEVPPVMKTFLAANCAVFHNTTTPECFFEKPYVFPSVESKKLPA